MRSEGFDYRHTQIGYVILGSVGAGLAIVAFAGLETPRLGAALLLLILAGILLVFSSLTTVVRAGVLEVYFGIGLIRRRIALADIREVSVVRNPWYRGWGLRYVVRGWLWNVSGFRAVELELANGRRFIVGSDEPEALAAAIREGQRSEAPPRSRSPS